ncbi:MAG TPA: hypothetical protein VD887_07975 [Allosphingosinicella sp.]|nr:hypothetical protein [Allosphingosinicella sp.]
MLAAALLLAAHPADAPPRHAEQPPVELIDFLGRRRECAERRPPTESDPPSPYAAADRFEWYFYACPGLPREEAAHRARFAGDANALAWLDDAPEDFDLGILETTAYHGPPGAEVRRIEYSGRTRAGPWRVALDLDAHPRAAALALAFPAGPNRTIWLEHGLFPWLDATSLRVAFDPEGRDERLILDLRYGLFRGWCGRIDGEDRPEISILVPERGAEISVARGERTNCRYSDEDVPPERFLHPPR